MANSRNKGHGYERDVAKFFRELGFSCTTSRYSNKQLDNEGKIDLCMDVFSVQCKAVERLGSPHTELAKIQDFPGKYRLLFHKKKRQGTTVSMGLSDFREILEMLIAHGAIKPK